MTKESKITPIQIIGILFAIVIAVGLLIGILNLIDMTGIFKVIGKTAPHMWVGALLFLFLSTKHEMNIEAIKKYTPGAAGGILTAYLITPAFEATVGVNVALGSFFVILVFAIISMVIGKFQIIGNSCFMLFLTVCTIPEISEGGFHLNYVIVLLVAALYFSGLFYIGQRISSKKSEIAQ